MLTAQARSVHRLRHDDGISYLAATGHQGAFAASKSELANRWVEASQWQAHWQPNAFGQFRQIGRDLAEKDIHPPLYFWLLHVWVSLVGVSLAAGPLLNTPLLLLACLAVSKSCRTLGCPPWAAAFAGLLWLFSGANLAVAEQARPYSLLGAVSALVLLGVLQHLKKPTAASSVGLFLLSVAGLLTQYHFLLLLAVFVALFTIRTRVTTERRDLAFFGVSTGAAIVTSAALHPAFHLSFQRQASQAQPFAWTEVPTRLARLVSVLLEQFSPKAMVHEFLHLLLRFWLPVTLLAVACTVVGTALIRRRDWKLPLSKVGQLEAVPLVVGFVCLTLIGALYVSCRSPAHAMDAKYIILATPALYVALGQAAASLHRAYPRVVITSVVALLVSQGAYGFATTATAVSAARESQKSPIPRDVPMVLDSTMRGVLPGVVWHLAPTTPVFAVRQEVLIREGLPDELNQAMVLYVSDPRYGNTAEATSSVLRDFDLRGYAVKQEFTTDLWPGRTFLLGRTGTQP
jgi:uncharacterized membrane protein